MLLPGLYSVNIKVGMRYALKKITDIVLSRLSLVPLFDVHICTRTNNTNIVLQ